MMKRSPLIWLSSLHGNAGMQRDILSKLQQSVPLASLENDSRPVAPKSSDGFMNPCASIEETPDINQQVILSLPPSRTLTPPPVPTPLREAQMVEIPRFSPITEVGDTDTASDSDLWQQELLETLYLHYGYTPPLPLPTTAPSVPIAEAEAKKLVRLVGML
ncbi:hypothetical protein DXG01_014967 [Tephrocybe rancida]|nr:hypothetical protein DXG01_014967 [Tephrocybe rancida]